MSVLSFLVTTLRNLIRALRLMRTICTMVDKMDVKLQASNASAGLKSASTTYKDASHTFCDLVEAFYEALPGD